jgi:hypothetical protein
MKQLRLLGLALMAVFALGAFASAVASADTSGILFLAGEEGPIAFSVKGGASTLATAAKKLSLTSTEVTGEGESLKEEEGKKTHYKLGTGTVTFTNVEEIKEATKGKCNTTGATAGTVVVPYDWHIFDALEGTTLQAGISFLILNPPLIIKCFAGTSKVEVKGAALGLLKCLPGQECLNGNVDVKNVLAHFQASGENCDSSGTFCANIKKEEPFLSNFNGTFEAAEETAEATLASVTKGGATEKMFFIDD